MGGVPPTAPPPPRTAGAVTSGAAAGCTTAKETKAEIVSAGGGRFNGTSGSSGQGAGKAEVRIAIEPGQSKLDMILSRVFSPPKTTHLFLSYIFPF